MSLPGTDRLCGGLDPGNGLNLPSHHPQTGSPNSVGAENLCHQAILMNHAPSAVAPLDPELVQVGDAVWQRAQRRGLVQGAVRPVRVVEVLVLAQDGHQVPLVPDQRSVQQLASAAANPAFHDRVHSRRLNGGADDPGTSGLEDRVECGGEAGVPVMQDELHSHSCIFQVHEQVPGLLHYPGLNADVQHLLDEAAAPPDPADPTAWPPPLATGTGRA